MFTIIGNSAVYSTCVHRPQIVCILIFNCCYCGWKHKSHFYIQWRQPKAKQSTHVVHIHTFIYLPQLARSILTSPPFSLSLSISPFSLSQFAVSCFGSPNTWIKYIFDLNEIYRNSILIDCLMFGYCFSFPIIFRISGRVCRCRLHVVRGCIHIVNACV